MFGCCLSSTIPNMLDANLDPALMTKYPFLVWVRYSIRDSYRKISSNPKITCMTVWQTHMSCTYCDVLCIKSRQLLDSDSIWSIWVKELRHRYRETEVERLVWTREAPTSMTSAYLIIRCFWWDWRVSPAQGLFTYGVSISKELHSNFCM